MENYYHLLTHRVIICVSIDNPMNESAISESSFKISGTFGQFAI